MFNFLNSAVLIAVAAALIPLLIHLFSKRKVKVIEFSSLKHLKEMQKRQVRRLKIRQLLLLILRMLIILVAVLAFARPASKGGYVGSHAGVSAAILFDRSASMQREATDGRLFDLAKQSTEDIIGNFDESDELILIPYDKEALFSAGERFFNREIAGSIIQDLQPGFKQGDLEGAYNKAISLLAGSKNLNKELYIVSDRQYNMLGSQADTADFEFSSFIVDLPSETDGNNGVASIDLGGQLIEVGSKFNVSGEIRNYDNFAKSDLLSSLFIDGVRIMQVEFSLDALGKKSVNFEHTVHAPGYHTGWVEISDDDFIADNRRYFTFQIPENFNVLIIDEDNSGRLVQLALTPSAQLARYWSTKIVSPDQLAGIKLNEYDAIVMTGHTEIGTAESSRILQFVDAGGGLLIFPGGAINTEAFNATFGQHVDLKYTKALPSYISGAGYYTLERLDISHPIFSAFDRPETDSLPTLRFFALPEYEDGSANRDLAYFSNGNSALVEAEYGLGKMMCMNAPLGPQYTDLSAHSFFVPFIIRALEYLAGNVGKYESENYVGENIHRSLSGKQVRYGDVVMITPDGQEFNIAGSESEGQLTYICQPINRPGIYQLVNSDKTVDLFPVNIKLSESDLAAASPDQISEALHLKNTKIIKYPEKSESIISTARYGRELWKIFLWAVVLLIAVEMFLAREAKENHET